MSARCFSSTFCPFLWLPGLAASLWVWELPLLALQYQCCQTLQPESLLSVSGMREWPLRPMPSLLECYPSCRDSWVSWIDAFRNGRQLCSAKWLSASDSIGKSRKWQIVNDDVWDRICTTGSVNT